MKNNLIISTASNITKSGAKKLTPALDATSGFNNLVTAWKEYKTIQENEATRREQIWADRDVKLAAIREQANTIRQLIEGTFDERSKNFDQYFDLLEKGFSSNNDQMINSALALIVNQTQVSPMAQAAQLMQSINDPDVKSIEI